MIGEKMARVSKRTPCPVCGKPDWCLVAPDGSAAICQRIEEGSKKRVGEAGWLHILRDDGLPRMPRPRKRTIPLTARPTKDFQALARQYRDRLTSKGLSGLAKGLGVSVQSLRRLGVGWNGAGFTFPMRNENGQIIGLRLRYPSGSRAAERGSSNGLFIPSGLPEAGLLLITEGESDVAAAADLGFAAVGRASCGTGGLMLTKLTRGRDVVVVGDNDAPGRRGAEALGAVLVLGCKSVCIVYPPEKIKDLRQWKAAGLTGEQLQAAIDAVEPARLDVHAKITPKEG